MPIFSSSRRGSAGRGQTQTAVDIEGLIDGADADMRAPGTYRELGRAVEAVVDDRVYEKAGTYEHAHPDDRAEAVMDVLGDEAVVVFSGTAPDGERRDFVVGNARRDVKAVLIPVDPVPVDGQGAAQIVIVTDAENVQSQNPWSARHADIELAEAIVAMARPDTSGPEEEIDMLREQLTEARETVGALEDQKKQLAEEVDALEQQLRDNG